MQGYLKILATTKNYNTNNASACERISQIYQHLKSNPEICNVEAKKLLKEALELKKLPDQEIKARLSPGFHLFCLPYAGGSASLYEAWQGQFSENIILHPLEYPGRGSKSREPLISRLEPLIEELFSEVNEILPKGAPFAFFGHSLGAIIAFELACYFQKYKSCVPEILFLSGSPPPDRIDHIPPISQMNDEEFISEIKKLNGTPETLIETKEFKSFFLPILRSDFSILDHYKSPSQKITVPLVVFGGNQDDRCSMEMLKHWEAWSEILPTFHTIQGGHFFIHKEQSVIEKIKESLCLLHF